jgi:transposase
MTKRKRRAFTAAYKAEVVELIRASGKSIGAVAKDLGLTETAVRAWVQRAEVETGGGPTGALTLAERSELTELRRRVKTLEMERDVLKKWSCAAAHPRRNESSTVSVASAPGQGRRLLVPRARKKMDPSAAPQAPRTVALVPARG